MRQVISLEYEAGFGARELNQAKHIMNDEVSTMLHTIIRQYIVLNNARPNMAAKRWAQTEIP